MKKVLILVLSIAFISVSAQAQDTFSKGTKLLKISGGFNSNAFPVSIAYEVGIVDGLFGVDKLNLGVGPYLGLYAYTNTTNPAGVEITTSVLAIGPGVTGYLHYPLMDKLEAYLGVSLGASVVSSSVKSSYGNSGPEGDLSFAWGLSAGLRYEITPRIGVFLDGGKGYGNLNLGVAFKF